MRKRGVRPQYCGRTAPGREDRLREIVRRELVPLTDEMRVDALGNLTAFLEEGHRADLTLV